MELGKELTGFTQVLSGNADTEETRNSRLPDWESGAWRSKERAAWALIKSAALLPPPSFYILHGCLICLGSLQPVGTTHSALDTDHMYIGVMAAAIRC